MLCLCCLVVLLAACGVRSAYNNLDWLAMRWLNQQISLNAEQDLMAREAIAQQLDWHCASELPAYIEFIERVERDVATDSISVVVLQSHGEQLAEFGTRLLERARPAVIDLLASLDDDQVEELLSGLAERNEERVAESAEATPEERRASRVDSMESGMRRFIGRLSAAQRERLEQWSGEIRSTALFDQAQRQARYQRLEKALAVRHDRPEFEARMSALLQPGALDPDAVPPRVERISRHNRERTLEALVDIHRLGGPRQVNRLRARLNRLAGDFETLSCQSQA